jgi:hypothetical protein
MPWKQTAWHFKMTIYFYHKFYIKNISKHNSTSK